MNKTTLPTALSTIACLLLFCSVARAQFLDATVNPLGAITGNFDAALELPITENFGIEPTVGFLFRNRNLLGERFRGRGFTVGARGKYYFNPEEDNDGFYGYAYGRYKRTRFTVRDEALDYGYTRNRVAVGVGGGYKYVARNGLLLDVGLGGGSAVVNRYSYDDVGFFGVGEVFSAITRLDIDLRLSIGYRLGN